ncbi:MAG: outer membrane protein assembly factor BamB family protein [Limisphaerales bacterium]
MHTPPIPRGTRPVRPCLLALIAAGTLVHLAGAADWSQWRGPFANGSSTETNLPSAFSKSDQVRWVTDLPGPSAATPVVQGNQVFVSSTDRSDGALLAMAFDRHTGREQWRNRTGERSQRDDRSNFASSSPVASGDHVFFFYASGDLFAFDLQGKPVWHRNLCADYGEFAFLWTFASSPLLSDGQLYIQVLQRDVPVNGRGKTDGPIASYLLALDPATGKELWKATRPSDAVGESFEAYSTPVPFTFEGRKELLVIGGDCLTGHDPKDGRELWRWGTWNPNKISHWRLVPSAVSGSGLILAAGPKNAPVFAIRAGGQGKLDDQAIAWSTASDKTITADVPTPLFYQGDFFILSDLRKTLTRLEAASGQVRWQIETPGSAKYEASPTGADGRIYLQNFKGEVVVVEAADGRLAHQTSLGESGDDRIRSSVVPAHGQLFVRTNQKLFCFGQP